jgi:hypothetical protein
LFSVLPESTWTKRLRWAGKLVVGGSRLDGVSLFHKPTVGVKKRRDRKMQHTPVESFGLVDPS